MMASGAGGHSKQEYTLLSGMSFCVRTRLSQAFQSVSKILVLRIAVVSGGVQPSPVSTSNTYEPQR